MAVTPQEMETQVFLRQLQGQGLFLSLPHRQLQAGCWPQPLRVGKQPSEHWSCLWGVAEQTQAVVAVLRWGSAMGQAAGMVWRDPLFLRPLWAAQCPGLGDSCHSVHQWERLGPIARWPCPLSPQVLQVPQWLQVTGLNLPMTAQELPAHPCPHRQLVPAKQPGSVLPGWEGWRAPLGFPLLCSLETRGMNQLC